jgi:hypothetical protein
MSETTLAFSTKTTNSFLSSNSLEEARTFSKLAIALRSASKVFRQLFSGKTR